MKTCLYKPVFVNPQAYFVFPQLYDMQPKTDNFVEQAIFTGRLIITEQILTADEMNQITGKIDELVDGVNTNSTNIPDVSEFVTTAELNNLLNNKNWNNDEY